MYTSCGYTEREATKHALAEEGDCDDVGPEPAGSIFPTSPRHVASWTFAGYPAATVLGVRYDKQSFAVFVAHSVGARRREQKVEKLGSERRQEPRPQKPDAPRHAPEDGCCVSPQPFSLIVVGGPSGAGKSRLAQTLAVRTASTVAQIDDIQTAIEALVPAERLPEYYLPSRTYLRTDSVEEIADAIEHLASFFAPAVRGVIGNRVESRTSTVFEGDFISPEAAADARSLGVTSLFLLASEDELRANYLARDGSEQEGRARVSAMRSRRLAQQCEGLGLPSLRARPFGTLLGRAVKALRLPA